MLEAAFSLSSSEDVVALAEAEEVRVEVALAAEVAEVAEVTVVALVAAEAKT